MIPIVFNFVFSISDFQFKPANSNNLFTTEHLKRIEAWKATFGAELSVLKNREWQLLWQMAAGYSNKVIAENMGLTKGIVEKYVSKILEKFDLKSRSALLVFLYEAHLNVFSRLSDHTRRVLLTV